MARTSVLSFKTEFLKPLAQAEQLGKPISLEYAILKFSIFQVFVVSILCMNSTVLKHRMSEMGTEKSELVVPPHGERSEEYINTKSNSISNISKIQTWWGPCIPILSQNLETNLLTTRLSDL